MRTVCRLCLLIIRASAIPAAFHFTALSLFSSYVIAHERTALEVLYIVSARTRDSYPSYFRENWENQIHNLLPSAITEMGLAIAETARHTETSFSGLEGVSTLRVRE